MSRGLLVKYRLFFYDLNETLIFWVAFQKNTQIFSFVKIRPVGVELFQADRRTDMKKLIVAFRNFAKAPKIYLWRNIA